AAACSRRRAIETVHNEFKTYLRGPRTQAPRTDPRPGPPGTTGLPHHLPGSPRHRRLRRRRHPDPISFTATLPAARRTITTARHDMHPALAHTGTEIPSALIPRRDRRISVRAVKQTRSPRTCKASHQRPKHTTPPAPPPPLGRPTPPSLTSANKPQKIHRTPLRFLALRPRDSKVHNAVAHWRATRPHRPGSLRTAAILAGMK